VRPVVWEGMVRPVVWEGMVRPVRGTGTSGWHEMVQDQWLKPSVLRVEYIQ